MDIEGRVKELTDLEARNEEMVGTINYKVQELESHKQDCEDRAPRIEELLTAAKLLAKASTTEPTNYEEFLTAAKLFAKASTTDEINQFDSDLDNAEADL